MQIVTKLYRQIRNNETCDIEYRASIDSPPANQTGSKRPSHYPLAKRRFGYTEAAESDVIESKSNRGNTILNSSFCAFAQEKVNC